MNARLAVLGVWLAALPIAVDLPVARDSSRAGQLLVEAAGGGGQFAIVTHGCEGQTRVTRNQLRSGALVVEYRLPEDFVIGVRAGNVQTTLNTSTETHGPAPAVADPESPRFRYTNPYVNPYLGYEGRRVGVGVGALVSDRRFDSGQLSIDSEMRNQGPSPTLHVRLGSERHRLTLRWMEDVPLESEGHYSADLGFRLSRQLETGVFVGLAGPYDGNMFGLRGRVWFTPAAALQIKASTAGGENGEYGVYGSVMARLPGLH